MTLDTKVKWSDVSGISTWMEWNEKCGRVDQVEWVVKRVYTRKLSSF